MNKFDWKGTFLPEFTNFGKSSVGNPQQGSQQTLTDRGQAHKKYHVKNHVKKSCRSLYTHKIDV